VDTYDIGIPARPPLIGTAFRVRPKGVPSRIAVVVKHNVGSYQDDVIAGVAGNWANPSWFKSALGMQFQKSMRKDVARPRSKEHAVG